MRVNSRIFTERTDMLDGFHIPNCEPQQLRVVAERLLTMVAMPGYSVGAYNTMTELDKKLMVDYWKLYDYLQDVLNGIGKFETWFPKHATEPELIRRARQWLTEHNYIFPDESVRERALQAGNKFRQAVKG